MWSYIFYPIYYYPPGAWCDYKQNMTTEPWRKFNTFRYLYINISGYVSKYVRQQWMENKLELRIKLKATVYMQINGMDKWLRLYSTKVKGNFINNDLLEKKKHFSLFSRLVGMNVNESCAFLLYWSFGITNLWPFPLDSITINGKQKQTTRRHAGRGSIESNRKKNRLAL